MTHQNNLKQIVVVTGTTCTGKSSLAVDICIKFNGEVINCDPAQFYKDLNVGVCKLTRTEMRGVKHHLISFLKYDEDYSLGQFVTAAQKLINEITARNKLPVIVGGTCLYIYWLIYPMINTPKRNKHFAEKYNSYTDEQLHQCLLAIDPQSAAYCHPANRRRVMRALEIYDSLKITKSKLISQSIHTKNYDYLMIELHDKSADYSKQIRARIDHQLNCGFIEEIKKIETALARGDKEKLQIKKILGYREILAYLEENMSKADMKQALVRLTMKIIRKQETFLQNKFLHKYYFNIGDELWPKIKNLVNLFLMYKLKQQKTCPC